MKLMTHALTEDQAKVIASWRYEGKYALYNLPTWDEMKAQNYALCDAVKRQRFLGFSQEEGELIGFINLLCEEDHVFFCMGVHPDYCNQGFGRDIIAYAIKESQKRHANLPLLLEVRTWNERAIRCYQSQNFKIIEKKKQETYLGLGEFYVMKYEHDDENC